MSEQSIGTRAAAGVFWLTLQTWATRLSGFVTMAVLARMLTPEDFGTVALAMSVLPIAYLLADLGLTTYIVQAEELDRRALNTAFWSSATVGLALAGAIAALAVPLAGFAGVPEAAPVIAAIAPVVFFVAVSSTPVALLRREMRFRVLSMQNAVAAIIGQIVALALAVWGAGAWALIAQALVMQLVSMTCAWYTARWHPGWTISIASLRTMLSFGSKVLSVDFIATGRSWVENVIVSRTLSVASLGEYGIAQRLVQTVRDLAGAALVPVSTVAFAKLRHEPERLMRAYSRGIRLSCAGTAPAMVFLLVGAPAVVPLLFGDQWEGSVAAVQALSVASIFALAAALDHGLLYGISRPGLWLGYAAVVEVATLATTIAVVNRGIGAVAWGLATVSAGALVARWFLVARVLHVRTTQIAAVIVRPLLILVPSAVAGGVTAMLVADLPDVVAASVIGVVVIVVHVAFVRWFLPATFADVVGFVRRRPQKAKEAHLAPR